MLDNTKKLSKRDGIHFSCWSKKIKKTRNQEKILDGIFPYELDGLL